MSDQIVCRQCSVSDGQLVACSSCEKAVLHEELCHHDYVGVFCDECDEFIDEENEEEESDEDEEWMKKIEEANTRVNRGPAMMPTFDENWEPGE